MYHSAGVVIAEDFLWVQLFPQFSRNLNYLIKELVWHAAKLRVRLVNKHQTGLKCVLHILATNDYSPACVQQAILLS